MIYVIFQERGVLVEVKCCVCGVVFDKAQHRINRTKSGKHYCSTECYHKDPIITQEKTGKEVSCAFCGSIIYRSGAQLLLPKHGKYFCSKKCSGQYKSKIINDNHNVICDNCGIAFRKSPSTISDTNFCCRDCWKEYIKSGGPIYYRKFKKDKCERCGFEPENKCQLDVHHDDGNKKNNEEENLITLCANCHRIVHYYERKKLIDNDKVIN